MKKSILALTLTSVTLIGCGGGGGSDTPTPAPTTTLQGKAIDGYLIGATAFLDTNYNGVLDEGEASTVTTESGDFNLDLTAANAECIDYAPIVVNVPVGAIDEDLGEVIEAYTLTLPPRAVALTDTEIANVTPLTSYIWDNVQADLNDLDVAVDCATLRTNVAVRANLADIVQGIAFNLAQHHNTSVTELFSDYVASGDTELYDAATDLVRGLKASYESNKAIRAAHPNASSATANYQLGTVQDNGRLNANWYLVENVFYPTVVTYKRTLLDTDTFAPVKVELDSERTVITANGFEYNHEIALEQDFEGNPVCAMNEIILATGSVKYGLTNNAMYTGSTRAECETGDIAGNITTRRVEVSESIADTEHNGTWFYREAFPVGLDEWINVRDNLANLDADALVSALAGYSTDFYDTDAHGADFWEHALAGGTGYMSHTSEGHWTRTTNRDDGTYLLECGASESGLTAQPAGVINCNGYFVNQ